MQRLTQNRRRLQMAISIDDILKIEKATTSEYNSHYVNSIAELYKEFRQKSKAPTFLL